MNMVYGYCHVDNEEKSKVNHEKFVQILTQEKQQTTATEHMS